MSVATLQWSAEQNREFESAARSAIESVRDGRLEIDAREFIATLDRLKGEHGRGFLLRLAEEWENLNQFTFRWVRLNQNSSDPHPAEQDNEPHEATESERNIQESLAVLRRLTASMWSGTCDVLSNYTQWIGHLRSGLPRLPASAFTRAGWEMVTELEYQSERLRELIRYVIVTSPTGQAIELPEHLAEQVWNVRISPFAHLRAMLNLWWSAIRHPLSETTIDLSTGRVLYRT